MPTFSRYFIRAGLIYLVLALSLVTLQELASLLDAKLPFSLPYATFVHLLTVGWLSQLIFGVMLWMFPKYSKDNPRRDPRWSWAVFGLLNAGLVLRLLVEPFIERPEGLAGGLLLLSALLQTAAIYAFVLNIWARVKER